MKLQVDIVQLYVYHRKLFECILKTFEVPFIVLNHMAKISASHPACIQLRPVTCSLLSLKTALAHNTCSPLKNRHMCSDSYASPHASVALQRRDHTWLLQEPAARPPVLSESSIRPDRGAVVLPLWVPLSKPIMAAVLCCLARSAHSPGFWGESGFSGLPSAG